MPEPQRYRKKPVEVEAMQVPDGGVGQLSVIDWIKGHGGKVGAYDGNVIQLNEPASDGSMWRWRWLGIKTLEGVMRADVGDFVIRGVQGEFYPCRDAIFEATYEPAATPEGDGEAFDPVAQARWDEQENLWK